MPDGRECRKALRNRLSLPVRYIESNDANCFCNCLNSKMRNAVRAELRERGIHALGMDSASDVARSVGTGVLPDAMVLEATEELAGDIRIQNLLERGPAVLILSRTLDLRVSLPKAACILSRPVLVEYDIVERVSELLERQSV